MARDQLKILEVKDVKKVGDKGAELLAFKAAGKDEKDLWYQTFRKSLFDAIRGHVGKVIEADVEVKTEERNGTEYTNRQVSQVYIEGQPVAVKGQYKGFRVSGRSPEEITSIETQVAVKAVTELVIAEKIAIDAPLAKALLTWCEERLTTPIKSPSRPVKQMARGNGNGGAGQAQEAEIGMSHIANIGEFFARAQKHWPDLKTKKQILDKIEVKNETNIANLDVAWEHLVAVMLVKKQEA